MKISIITSTYNSEKTVQETLESILNQTHQDIELLIIDGKSKDNTLEIVRRYERLFQGRLRYISEQDKGIYDAMNKGIQMATGDVVGILNSDDLYMDNKVVEDIANAFVQTNVDAIYGNLIFVDEDDTSKIVRVWKGSQYEPGSFLNGWHPAHPTFYVRRDIYEKYGLFDISFDVSADFELMLRFIEKHRISNRYLDRTFIKMRMGGESTGSIKKIITGNRNVLRAFEKNGFKVSIVYPIKRLLPKAINMIKNKIKLER